jgi:hypothetical protein
VWGGVEGGGIFVGGAIAFIAFIAVGVANACWVPKLLNVHSKKLP